VTLYAGTFSIVAADRSTGEVGCAAQSKYLAIGAVTPWVRAGVGAVATQATRVVARNDHLEPIIELRRLLTLWRQRQAERGAVTA
jgi:uncharacterized Ntn-hydrolase superfamily protein